MDDEDDTNFIDSNSKIEQDASLFDTLLVTGDNGTNLDSSLSTIQLMTDMNSMDKEFDEKQFSSYKELLQSLFAEEGDDLIIDEFLRTVEGRNPDMQYLVDGFITFKENKNSDTYNPFN